MGYLMSQPIKPPPWTDGTTPEERLAFCMDRFAGAVEQYVLADLEAREAGKRRNRALSLMRDIRHTMAQLAAERNLKLPSTRFSHLLDENDESP